MKKLLNTRWLGIVAAIAAMTLLATTLAAQGIYATLTGVVSDPSQAAIVGAKVTLTDAQSGSVRTTVTNGDGYFTFASVPVGTYNVAIEAKGFETFKVSGFSLSGAEKRNINATLKVGTTSETVEITGTADTIVPVDSGEKSATLTTKELQNFVSVGSNAAEFIKIMPGFGIQNGTSNKSNYTGETIGINANGDAGSQSPLNNAFSYNGLPSNSLDITADGAHVSDPGCNCDTPVNPELRHDGRVQGSHLELQRRKPEGAGGHHFGGQIGRQGFPRFGLLLRPQLRDERQRRAVQRQRAAAAGEQVLLSGLHDRRPGPDPRHHFNKNRNKLFFFTGYEYFYQMLDTGLLRATVPTAGEIAGNFSPAEVAKEGNITASGGPPGTVECGSPAAGTWRHPAAVPDRPEHAGSDETLPAPNADPNATGGYNYVQAETFNQNNIQWMSRVDYSISDNTKLFVRYNLQRETQLFPVGLWWRNGGPGPISRRRWKARIVRTRSPHR